jgi:hypothetical protein
MNTIASESQGKSENILLLYNTAGHEAKISWEDQTLGPDFFYVKIY